MNRKSFIGLFLGGVASVFGLKKSEHEIPQSFLDGMDDYKNGRVVDMETALNEPYPGSYAVGSGNSYTVFYRDGKFYNYTGVTPIHLTYT